MRVPTIEALRTPEGTWLRLLENVSKQDFFIQTSTPHNVPEGSKGGFRVTQYAKNETNGKLDDEGKGIAETLHYNFNNKEIFRRTPEVVVFTPDNKLLYMVNSTDAYREAYKKSNGSKPVYELSEKNQVLWRMAGWRDIHSFPPRGGNIINLVINLEPSLREELEKNVYDNPVKIREVLKKIVEERMHLKDYWRTWNPEILRFQDIPTQACSSEKMPGSSIRPPWEFWEKLGLDEIFIQYSDSSSAKPHTEFRKVKSDPQ